MVLNNHPGRTAFQQMLVIGRMERGEPAVKPSDYRIWGIHPETKDIPAKTENTGPRGKDGT